MTGVQTCALPISRAVDRAELELFPETIREVPASERFFAGGDTTGYGMVQVSFTLPMPHSKLAEGAAQQLATKMGLSPAMVVHAKAMGPDFTFFVVYGRVHHLVDVSKVQVVERARAEKADAVLVSQVVTQRDAHILNTREMSAAFRESYPSDRRPLLIVGGPRFDEAMSAELGVDRVFSRGTTPGEVASYLVNQVVPTAPAPKAKAS